jgi:hypothetical protein
MIDDIICPAAMSTKHCQIHAIQTSPQAKDSRNQKMGKNQVDPHKRLHTNDSAKTSINADKSRTKVNFTDNPHVKHKADNCHRSQYEPILRPWKNIKRAGNETAIKKMSPMERWDAESVGDQPWNAIGIVSRQYGVVFETHENDEALLEEWDTWYEGVDQSSMICEDSSICTGQELSDEEIS